MNKILKNVLGTELQSCCTDPLTGYYRDGFCKTGDQDVGTHVLCAIMTEEFLKYTKSKGNDLSTPRPEWQFPGLKPGDKWCLCISRWIEAEKAGMAPQVVLEATHDKALEYTNFELLLEYKYSAISG
ncbi:hypothetical protein LCGC14_1333500 [marine sediment metagenome]|uniref:DUF2237 domain-containing protein n=2 Tax=root TaxID=1 RepID=A0A831QKB3_9FLAO|nr:DUF2237 domain-containing protein [Pricia antarctica]